MSGEVNWFVVDISLFTGLIEWNINGEKFNNFCVCTNELQ